MTTKYNLSEEEILFCELYAHGEAPFGGNAARCYEEVFHDKSISCQSKALKLLSESRIHKFLKSLDEITYEEAKYMKTFLTENLKHIIQECATAEYRDRRGTLLSPAALRSVAVSASKALMELHPIKEAHQTKLQIDGAGEGGITFNVIMPEQSKTEPTIEKEA